MIINPRVFCGFACRPASACFSTMWWSLRNISARWRCRRGWASPAGGGIAEAQRPRGGGRRPLTTAVTSPVPSAETFVSSYYRIDPGVITSFLSRHNISYRQNHLQQLLVKVCPFCHDTKSHPSNMYKLYIYLDNGRHYCFRCNAQGSWFDFQQRLSKYVPTVSSKAASQTPPELPPTIPQSRIDGYCSNLASLPEVSAYLTERRGLQLSTVTRYAVGACVFRASGGGEHPCVTFPWIDRDGSPIRVKIRSIRAKSMQRLEPIGGTWGWFGGHLVTPSTRRVVITEGEFDAMAVSQATGSVAISLPAGANCFPAELIRPLENVTEIAIWMDDDVVGQAGTQKLATKLGRERCRIVRASATHPGGMMGGSGPQSAAPSPKDANEALLAKCDLHAILAAARSLPHQQIVGFSQLRDQVYCELKNPAQVAGTQSTTLPSLNRLLRGLRRGELTLVTGATGAGKTTLLAQLSLDYAMQGIATLWGSFEISNVRLAKKLLNQFAGRDLERELHSFDRVAADFSGLPLYFMRFHGATDIEQVIDAMEYATYVHDVEHVIIDNLQFMTPVKGGGFERFEALETSVSRLRAFATHKNVHISLIIHPRKEDAMLSTNSIFGSARAAQEADNVLIVQRARTHKYLEVAKNRFSGDLGKIPYQYDREAMRFVELTPEEIAELNRGHGGSMGSHSGGGDLKRTSSQQGS